MNDPDLAAVPVYPVVRIGIAAAGAPEGTVYGYVDYRVVASGPEEEVRAALIAEVATLARERPGHAIRAVGTDAAGERWRLIVTGDERAFDLPDEEPRRSGSGRPRWLLPLIAAVGAVLVAVVVVAVLLIVPGAEPTGTPTAPAPALGPTEMPVASPPGWSSRAAWSVPVGGSGGADRQPVSTDGEHVYAPGDTAESVHAYRVQDGVRLWTAAVDGAVSTGPAVSTIDGAPAVVAATTTHLYAWNPVTGAPVGEWELPRTSARVAITPGGPMVTSDSQHTQIVVQGRLTGRVLPAGGEPVAPVGPDALVVAGPPGRVWTARSDRLAGDPAPLAAPANTTFLGVAGLTRDTVVAAFAPVPTSGSTVVLAGFDILTHQHRWTSRPVPQARTMASTPGKSVLAAAPSGAWGVYGSVVVDLTRGAVVDLPAGFRVSTLGEDSGFGVVDGVPVTLTRAGLTPPSSAALARPKGERRTAVGGDSAPGAVAGPWAFTIAADGRDRHLYATLGGAGR